MVFDFGQAALMWFVLRIPGALLILRLLHVLLRTATRRKERAYLAHVSLPERYFGAYMLRITDFKRPLVLSLVVFHAVCFAVSCLILILWAADLLTGGAVAACIPDFRFEIVCLVPFFVPVLTDLVLTVYPDGHPHFRFDAFAPAVRPRDKARIQTLLREAKASLRCMPERFAAQRAGRRVFALWRKDDEKRL